MIQINSNISSERCGSGTVVALESDLRTRFPQSTITCEDDPQRIMLLACAMSQENSCQTLQAQLEAGTLSSSVWGGLLFVVFVVGCACTLLAVYMVQRRHKP